MENQFDYDVFISYARKDNGTSSGRDGGWISMLHRALEVRLDQLLPRDAQIWRDPRLSGNDVLADELIATVSRAAVLVSILSPRYLGSTWCDEELKTFMKAANDVDMEPANKSRIFKVIKTPVPLKDQPAPLQKLLGYPFYTEDPEKQRHREFYPEWGPQAREEAAARLDDLAHEIRDLLIALQAEKGATTGEDKGAVYLATTTSDQSQPRDQLARELRSRGYRVLPDRHLPQIGVELEAEVQGWLDKSLMSVHLVGANYGVVPEAAESSVVELQVELAASQSAARDDFSQLIWMSDDLSPATRQQQAFVNCLRTELDLQAGDDVLETPFQELRTELKSRLENLESGRGQVRDPNLDSAIGVENEPTSIYLLYDQLDRREIKPLRQHLFEKGFEVERPVFEGDEAELAEGHADRLRRCHAVLIYWGQGSEAWVDVKLRELRKARGERGGRVFLSTGVYLAQPQTDAKEDFLTRTAVLIDGLDGFAAESLAEFLAPLPVSEEGDTGD